MINGQNAMEQIDVLTGKTLNALCENAKTKTPHLFYGRDMVKCVLLQTVKVVQFW